MPRQKSKNEGYNLIRECIGIIKRGQNVIAPLDDDEYIILSGKELREYATEVERDIKMRNGIHTEMKTFIGFKKYVNL